MPTFGNFEFNTKATLICFCFFAAIGLYVLFAKFKNFRQKSILRKLQKNMSRKTPKSTPNLLRQALTKTIINDETPNHSANNTAVGVEKAKTQFNLFKVDPFLFLPIK